MEEKGRDYQIIWYRHSPLVVLVDCEDYLAT
jgi:hypothetical protein